MKAFGNFRINAKSNFQSEGQAEQDDEGQILSLIFQCGFSEMVLLFFFLLVCEILSPVCPPKIFFKKNYILIYNTLCNRNIICVGQINILHREVRGDYQRLAYIINDY